MRHLCITVVGLAIATSALTVAHGAEYRVIASSGDVESWSLRQPRWKVVEAGQQLIEEQLVRVGAESNVHLTWEEAGAAQELRIETPMMLRLSASTLRQVQQETLMISRLPDVWRETGGELQLAWQEVWHRTLLRIGSLSVFDDDQKDIYETVKQQSFFVKRGESSALKLRYPVQGLVLFPERLPTQLRVEWEPTTSGNYQIFMWQSGQPGSPVGSISGASHFYVNLPSYGGYFLMVKDHDGRKSPVVSFELPVPSSLWSDEVSVLTLKHPASAAEYHVGDRADVMFDWSASGRGRRYTLSIESIDVPSKKIAVEMPPVSVRLEPGVYRWSVSADSTALPRVEPLESERRSLVVSTDRMGIAGAFGQAVENLPKQTHPTVSMFFE